MGSFGKPLFRLVGALLAAAILLAIPFGTQWGPSPVFAQTPSVSTVTAAVTGATTATVTVTLSTSVTDTPVYRQFKTSVNTEWSDTIEETANGISVAFSLTGLDSGTGYVARASLDENFASGVVTSAEFTTGTPSISTVADSEVGHDSAKITVTVAYPNNTIVYLQHKEDGEDWPATTTRQTDTTGSTGTSEDLEFTISSLDDSTDYDVRASLNSDFSSSTEDDFTTTATPPAIEDVADSEVDHNSAKITVTVSNAGTGTTVYLQHKKRSTTSWPATSTAQQRTATSSSPSPTHAYS